MGGGCIIGGVYAIRWATIAITRLCLTKTSVCHASEKKSKFFAIVAVGDGDVPKVLLFCNFSFDHKHRKRRRKPRAEGAIFPP